MGEVPLYCRTWGGAGAYSQVTCVHCVYRGILLIRNRFLLVPCSSPVPRGLGWS